MTLLPGKNARTAMQKRCMLNDCIVGVSILAVCRETEFFALTNAASWLQPYGKFFMVMRLPSCHS